MPKDRSAQRSGHECGGKGPHRGDRGHRRTQMREKHGGKHQRCGGGVNDEVVELDCRPDKARSRNPFHRRDTGGGVNRHNRTICTTRLTHGWLPQTDPRAGGNKYPFAVRLHLNTEMTVSERRPTLASPPGRTSRSGRPDTRRAEPTHHRATPRGLAVSASAGLGFASSTLL